jgi:hypothetical protein
MDLQRFDRYKVTAHHGGEISGLLLGEAQTIFTPDDLA